MERNTFWWVIIIAVVVVFAAGYLILKDSKTLGVTGGAVIIQTDRGTYELRPGTTLTIDSGGSWIVTETVVIPTTRGTITIEEGTELTIEPDPEPNYPHPAGG
ncbi:MAG: hypothetical protein ACP5NS_04035 [Candidatus Pacearchaeota archaeon]